MKVFQLSFMDLQRSKLSTVNKNESILIYQLSPGKQILRFESKFVGGSSQRLEKWGLCVDFRQSKFAAM